MDAPAFSRKMSKERFRNIKRYLRLADNSDLAASTMQDASFEMFESKYNFQKFGVFHKLPITDESVIMISRS